MMLPRALLAIGLAFSLIFIGFSHRPLVSEAQLAQARDLASLGLTASDLCDIADDEDSAAAPLCEACTLTAGMLLPAMAVGPALAERRVADAALIPIKAHHHGRPQNPAAPPRAPPLA